MPLFSQFAPRTSSKGSVARIEASTAVELLCASNPARKACTIVNESPAPLYLALGTGASSTIYTVILNSSDYYEAPSGYTGLISGAWDAAIGAALVTELT